MVTSAGGVEATVVVAGALSQEVLDVIRAVGGGPGRIVVVLVTTGLETAGAATEATTARNAPDGTVLRLSDRERAVLALLADGHDTTQIARELSYSARTVTGIVYGITHRFQLRNRAHAVAHALRAGWLTDLAEPSAQGLGVARAPLTARQEAVLALMAEGHSNSAIARELSCSPHTVKNVSSELLARLEARNRVQAVACAIRVGLI